MWGISSFHIENLLKRDEARIEALVDISQEATNSKNYLLEKEGKKASCYRDFEKVIKKVDAAVVCTPHTLHYEQCKAFLEENKHVLVEKPFVLSVKETMELINLSESKNLVLEIAYQRHFQPMYIEAKNFFAKTGKLKAASAILAQNWYEGHKKTWRHTKNAEEGN